MFLFFKIIENFNIINKENKLILKSNRTAQKIGEQIKKANSLDRLRGLYLARGKNFDQLNRIGVLQKIADEFREEYENLVQAIPSEENFDSSGMTYLWLGDLLRDILQDRLDIAVLLNLLAPLDKLRIKNMKIIYLVGEVILTELKKENIYLRNSYLSGLLLALANFNLDEPWVKEIFDLVKPIVVSRVKSFFPNQLVNIFWAYAVAAEKDLEFMSAIFTEIGKPEIYAKFNRDALHKLYEIVTYYNLELEKEFFVCPADLAEALRNNKLDVTIKISDFQKKVMSVFSDLGYTVELEYSLGGYLVDGFVRINRKSYVIECDGDVYHYFRDGSLFGKYVLRDRILRLLKCRVIHIKKSDFDRAHDKKEFIKQTISFKFQRVVSDEQIKKLKELQKRLTL